jgi:hypothetical protein
MGVGRQIGGRFEERSEEEIGERSEEEFEENIIWSIRYSAACLSLVGSAFGSRSTPVMEL